MIAVDWIGVGLGTLGSLAVGAALWIVLPRGVILTKTHPVRSPFGGELLPDTWSIKNVSALPAKIESVTVRHLGMDSPMELPIDGIGTAKMRFDDTVLETRRDDRAVIWSRLEVPPGESLTVLVGVNHMLTIKYRRGGPTGFFERRKLVIHGYA